FRDRNTCARSINALGRAAIPIQYMGEERRMQSASMILSCQMSIPSRWIHILSFSQALHPRQILIFASVSGTFWTETSGSSAIDASTQSSSVSEFPFRRGLPANARTLIVITLFYVILVEK